MGGRDRGTAATTGSPKRRVRQTGTVGVRKLRPAIDERMDGELSRRLSPRDHRYFWCGEAPALGGMTPYEALLAGQREAVIELAMGRPAADATTPLISPRAGARMLATLGGVVPRPPYGP
jgi:hypothetical protein